MKTGRRLLQSIAATGGDVTTNLSPGAGKRWKILYGMLTITTDGTVANRQIQVRIMSPTALIHHLMESATRAATGTLAMHFGMGRDGQIGGTLGYTGVNYIPFQEFEIQGTEQFRIYITAGVAGDSYSGEVMIEETDV